MVNILLTTLHISAYSIFVDKRKLMMHGCDMIKPEDKFGRPIYPKVYQKLISNAEKLKKSGYKESFNKSNLFYKKIPEGCFFADMRSSDIVPIWTDTRPLFYRKWEKDIPHWKKRRLIKQELEHLYKIGCECRLSFYTPRSWIEFENSSTIIDEGYYYWDDGFCEQCGKDFQDEGSFCSKECEEKHHLSMLNECTICGKKLEYDEEIHHHVDYKNDVTILVCRTCHAKIHHSTDEAYKQYKPINKRPKKKKRKYVMVDCNRCDGKTRIRIEDYDPAKKYICYKCRPKNFKHCIEDGYVDCGGYLYHPPKEKNEIYTEGSVEEMLESISDIDRKKQEKEMN